ncbi:hypothetical protein PAHA111176_08965 [Parendozoicomonas haliclonae]|uniref:Uncharacterized protein n=2 Tax=Parendozoicomonas haliclonae TaxID=1960125 RepID=A0A1X7API5_9GAMM|nr:hypothetical protein EHSB41UT_03801 [Parendozoicomonas haliclonae]
MLQSSSSSISSTMPDTFWWVMPLIVVFCALYLSGCASNPTQKKNSSSKAAPIDVLFVAYDNGDGRAFLRALPELAAKNIKAQVITFGPAAGLFADNNNITQLHEQLSPEEQQQLFESRTALLPESLRSTLVKQFQPKVVITGMAHIGQAQIARDFWNTGVWTIAFYDNLESPEGQQWVQPWLELTRPVAEELLVTTVLLKNSFPEDYTHKHRTSVVRHPALNEWQESFANNTKASLKQGLNLDERPVILVAGGYGEDFQRSLAVIEEAAALRSDLQWLMTPHPRTVNTRGESTTPQPENLRLITEVPTVTLGATADLVITHRSTVGWLASQMGLPVIFVRPESTTDHLMGGRIQMVNNPASLLNALHRQLDTSYSPAPMNDTAGQPSLVDIIEQRLQPPESKQPQMEVIENR